VLLAGCDSTRALAFFEEAYWASLAESGDVLEERLRAAAETRGFGLEVVVSSSADPRAELQGLLATWTGQVVVLTPLLSLEAGAIAASSPELRFISIDGVPTDRASTVRFEVGPAMVRAGRAVARYLDQVGDARVATIVRAEGSLEARDSFALGFAAEAGQSRILARQLQATADRVRLRRLIEGLVRDGVRVFFLDVGSLASVGLAAVQDQEAMIVARNWGSRAGFDDLILLSVDDDLAAALGSGLAAPSGTAVTVPARVVWGSAAALPADVRPLLDLVPALPPSSP
jgi:hypothetical protein